MSETAIQWLLGIAGTIIAAALGALRAMIGTKLGATDFDREITAVRERSKTVEERVDRIRDALDDRVRKAELTALWDAFTQMQRQVSGLEARMSEMMQSQRDSSRRLDELHGDNRKIFEVVNRIAARMNIPPEGQ